MCRFAGYIGKEPVLLSEILVTPENSLIKQSMEARQGAHHVNADGFGIAWYDLSINNEPAIYKTIQPAWSDQNLQHLSARLKSKCFIAHVRASTVGSISYSNCHPFHYGKYSMAHNGTIYKFDNLKLKLLNFMDPELFLQIKGNTDSEIFFFLVMHYLKHKASSLLEAVKQAFDWLKREQDNGDIDSFARLNIIISDGKQLIATKCVIENDKALSLYYSQSVNSVIIASEPLDEHNSSWIEIPKNYYILAEEGNILEIKEI
ncbi:MAG: class II glutamine amidotransferase [Rickettsiaceae bacterium]|nr:class II glutamine amidotransferase [Rickettsiaceae bacterium]